MDINWSRKLKPGRTIWSKRLTLGTIVRYATANYDHLYLIIENDDHKRPSVYNSWDLNLSCRVIIQPCDNSYWSLIYEPK